jgi:hypothetical protein
MTFFYDLNKKLDSIREKPETTHGQLNERDMSRAAKGYEKYGKQGHLSVPPLVVRPMNNTEGSASGIIVDPTRNSPIDISKARFTKMTPAERFIQFSQIGLLVMALGAVVLTLVAVSRAIRRK